MGYSKAQRQHNLKLFKSSSKPLCFGSKDEPYYYNEDDYGRRTYNYTTNDLDGLELQMLNKLINNSTMIDEDLLFELEENECLVADGLEDALIGVSGGTNPVAVYDIEKCLDILENQFKDESDEPRIDAIEYFEFNVIGSYVGEKTPIFIYYYG